MVVSDCIRRMTNPGRMSLPLLIGTADWNCTTDEGAPVLHLSKKAIKSQRLAVVKSVHTSEFQNPCHSIRAITRCNDNSAMGTDAVVLLSLHVLSVSINGCLA